MFVGEMSRDSHEPPPPTTQRGTPRVDVFGAAHAALREDLAGMLAALSRARFEDEEAARAIAIGVVDVVVACERHRAHEERLVLPALRERLHGPLSSIDDGHEREERLAAELRALAAGLVRATRERRVLGGRTLTLHFSRWAAEVLLHMADEEQVVQPLLDRLFQDAELIGMTTTARAERAPSAISAP